MKRALFVFMLVSVSCTRGGRSSVPSNSQPASQPVSEPTATPTPAVDAGGAPAAALDLPIEIVTPLPLQVLQRQALSTPVSLTLKLASAIDSVEYRLLNSQNQEIQGWKKLSAISGATASATQNITAGGWYHFEVRGFAKGKPGAVVSSEKFGVGEVFIAAGESNSANYGSALQSPKSNQVVAWNGSGWQTAADPQPAAPGTGGSPWPAMGDILAAELKVPIAFLSVGYAGTTISDWQPGGVFYPRLQKALKAVGKNGARAVLWHHGESDTFSQTAALTYYNALQAVVKQSALDAGYDIPWLLAKASYAGSSYAAHQHPITQAQGWSIDMKRVFPGATTDDLQGAERSSDGFHFSATGLQEHGRRWAMATLQFIRNGPSHLGALGLGRANFVWAHEDTENRTRDRAFADINIMKHAGVKVVRTDMRGLSSGGSLSVDIKRLTDVLKQMQDQGMKALVAIMPDSYDYVEPEKAWAQDDGSGEFEKKCGWKGGQLRIAWIDTQRYLDRVQKHFDAFKKAGINNIVAFEVFNEPDLVCFNGDIWIGGKDVFNADTITKYAEILKVSYKTIKQNYPDAKVVTAGLANLGLLWPDSMGWIHPANFLKWVNSVKDANGNGAIDLYADAIGAHIYPMEQSLGPGSISYVIDQLNTAVGGIKPFWITEYGYSRKMVTDEETRANLFESSVKFVREQPSFKIEYFFPFALNDAAETGLEMVEFKDPSFKGSVPLSCQAPFFPAPIPTSCEDKPLLSLRIFSRLK